MKSSSNIYTKKTIQDSLLWNFKRLIIGKEMSDRIEYCEKFYFLEDPDFKTVDEIMKSHKKENNEVNQKLKENHFSKLSPQISRAIACFVCSGIGDALGTHIEFQPVEYDREPLIIGFKKEDVFLNISRCNLGEFSDDTSMALCLADHILFRNYELNPADLQIKFINWWYFSYNNCLEPRRHSFGLGGNINLSMKNFIKKCQSTDIYNRIYKQKLSDEEFLSILNENIKLD